tara:strand:- start:109 stop:336 length:228 start_codon:yes stop_codon:yes gene_type:complete
MAISFRRKSNYRRKTQRKRQRGGHHLYKMLGVSKYASRKQIKQKYKKIQKAYKILLNKATRKKYNKSYRNREIKK